MRKILFVFLVLLSMCFISCNKDNNQDVNNYKITFVNALDEVVWEYMIQEGKNIVYPTSAEMKVEGYRFLDSYDKTVTTANKDEIIKGNYIKTWIVSFYNESNELISTQIIDDGQSAESPELQPKDGYLFKGWKTDFTNVTSDLDVYGDYEQLTYTLTYNSNIEDSIICEFDSNSEIAYNTTVKLKAKKVTGYTFLGFFENDELVTDESEYIFKMKDNHSITVKYTIIDLEIEVENGVIFVYFGTYPQTLVEDSSLISELDTLVTDENGYITYNGTTYCKETANLYNATSYKSLSGNTNITNGKTYYFIVEPIKWRVIETSKNTYELLSEYSLDAGAFYSGVDGDLSIRNIDGQTVYANNYKYSDVREYLNTVFYNLAFSNEDKDIIKTTLVDNSSKTGLDFNSDMDPTAYACENTNDKVYLISYKDYENKPINKQSLATDYAIARGCWIQQYNASTLNYTYWWFRTPNPAYADITWFNMCALNADDEGGFDWNLYVIYRYVGYRPAITIAK